jgi:ERCC4-type nuclease
MDIILDVRERALIELMPDVPTEQLPVGDIWIGKDQEGGVVIERKTTSDFEASILDGRYREQRTRLLAYCAEKKARPLYIIEEGLNGRKRTLQRQALQKMLNRLMLRYNVSVWLTECLDDTVSAIKILEAQLKDDPKVFIAETLSYTDVMHTTKKSNTGDPRVFAVASLQQCPGVSAKAASALIDAFGSLKSVMEQDEKALANVKVGERRFGPANAKKLLALLSPI